MVTFSYFDKKNYNGKVNSSLLEDKVIKNGFMFRL